LAIIPVFLIKMNVLII